MKLYITGAYGMVGRNLLENIFITKQSLITPTRSELDLMDFNAVKNFILDTRPDLIIHTAGRVGGIQANMKDPYYYLMDNMVIGMNLVRAALECNINNFLNLASSCAYPHNAPNPLKEEFVLNGQFEPTNEGYALAKTATLRACEFASYQFKVNYKTLIPCNLYGRFDKFGENNSHMIPAVIKKIHQAKVNNLSSVEIWGDGTVRREGMYATDLTNLIAYAIQNFEKLPVIMNTGPGYDYSINEYYNTVAEIIGYTGSFTHDLTKPAGMKQKLLDISKQLKFGYHPSYSLKEGIIKTYEYYLEHRDN